MQRTSHLLARIDPAIQRGLEIGPLNRPVVRPGDGPVRYADHLSTDGLRAKYAADPAVDVRELVPIDYVLGPEGLAAATRGDTFDYVLASHVIEHVPDFVGFLCDTAAILVPGGILSLAVPDKRWTFDCRRDVTPVAALLEAYLEGYRRPSIRQVIDHFLEHAAVPAAVTEAQLWNGEVRAADVPYTHVPALYEIGEAGLRRYAEAIRAGEYIDSHCTVFTPQSFLRILDVLARLGLLGFELAHFADTPQGGTEFFASLRKLPEGGTAQRSRAALKSLANYGSIH